ncbi:MAG TPA: RNA pseudouridine synthase, partial [Pseudobdellovibrionaceae bacterium]|nr:RNA pseudouridine synthase [Pseudobdellovibrionaceae bacterium]
MDQHQRQSGYHYGVKHLLVAENESATEMTSWLKKHLELDSDKINQLVLLGSVYWNGKRQLSDRLVLAGDYIRVHTRPRRFPVQELQSEIRLIDETPDYAAYFKPAGIPVHPTVDNIQENLLAFLNQKQGRPYFLTHRLDVPTEGVILFARHKEFQTHFNCLLRDGRVQKFYRAIVASEKPSATLLGLHTHYMTESPYAPKVVSPEPTENSLECKLDVIQVKEIPHGLYEIQIRLITGRTHQIRAQLSALGFSILGDQMYGGSPIKPEQKQ